jgi:hypothetical protein
MHGSQDPNSSMRFTYDKSRPTMRTLDLATTKDAYSFPGRRNHIG